ncbi:MAG: hypothetical protein ACYCT7_01545 [bacterium]
MKSNDNFKKIDIPVKELILWDENARFPDRYFKKSEAELIKHFVSKKDFKIKELAEAVIKDFDIPPIEKIVVYKNENGFVVLEGNRRITVYKLLINPNLTENDVLRKFFEEQKLKIAIDDNFTIESLVVEDIEQGLRYIDRKHVAGNYEVNWGDTERAYYNKRRGSAKKKELFKIAITKIINSLDIPDTLKEQVLGPGYVTTFFRIIDSEPAFKLFGFELDDSGCLKIKDKDFNEKLKVIILNVLGKEDFNGNKIDSRSLNKNNEKESYLKSIKTDDFEKVKDKIKKSKTENLFGEEVIEIKNQSAKRSIPKSTARDYLIPRTCNLIIKETKINNIYRELRDDLLLDDSKKAVPNAAGVLFRVFLEVSIDCFLERVGLELSSDTKLAGKITKTAEYMKNNKIADDKQLKNFRKVAIAGQSILSIDNFHDYVHSYKTMPNSNDLKTNWDNLQEFFQILWGYLDKKSK